jgi:hypothetical protein
MPKIAYVAYIDESGDDGVARVRPTDETGASEWFALSAVLVRAQFQRETVWVKDILGKIALPQRRELHYQPLDDWRKPIVCQQIGSLPVRCFVVLSNKINMRGHSNQRAAKSQPSLGRTWFYWWCTRLLLERVTDYCERRSLRDYGESRAVRLEFSRRLGLRYSHLQSYLYWLRIQSKASMLYLDQGDIKWSVLDPMNGIAVYDHGERAGLQLADAVASACYQGVAGLPVPTPNHAKLLAPRMALNRKNKVFGYGFKLMPGNYLMRSPSHQRPLLEFFSKM